MRNERGEGIVGSKRPQLTSEQLRAYAARVSTILQAGLPASAYFLAVQRAWESMPLVADAEQFNRLIIWVSKATRTCNQPGSWYRFFQEITEEGISERVWEREATPPPLMELKRQVATGPSMVQAAEGNFQPPQQPVGRVQPARSASMPAPALVTPQLPGTTVAQVSDGSSQPRRSSAERLQPKRSAPHTSAHVEAPANVDERADQSPVSKEPPRVPTPDRSDASEESTWGQGSVRLGPRWTTRKKPADFYSYAELRFDDEE